MDIHIRQLTADNQDDWIDFDDSFTVDSILILHANHNKIGYTVKEIPRYEKSYSSDPNEETTDSDYSAYIANPNQIVYLAYLENKAVGQIILKKNWNHYAYIEDIKVDKQSRRSGAGRLLIEQAKQWAKSAGLPGIMLETQNNNVRACKFYESCGFVIGGFDSFLYKGLDESSNEIAIFWYFTFE
ncbi:GNAT family N-acetyltransferase [Bacillus sp. FJAT-26390]|uniref:GNAT family N-acetyltransferase n=1 Tax=Bacillus sp. FJAT-26390 TaxID=1743142 RepID=UPI00080805B3|nr:GNAT family N-acetyltransferase [Bacillus sp. FJAT-26390]OBZ16558.1 streptothricin acetyltransferase [Bacillus sp. FJAT-26390]